MRYDDFSFDIEADILNLCERHASSHVYIISLICYRRNVFGTVKADKFHIASIPMDYSKPDRGKSEAIKIGRAAVKKARERNG